MKEARWRDTLATSESRHALQFHAATGYIGAQPSTRNDAHRYDSETEVPSLSTELSLNHGAPIDFSSTATVALIQLVIVC